VVLSREASRRAWGGVHGEAFKLSHPSVEEQEKQISHPFEQYLRLRPLSGRAKKAGALGPTALREATILGGELPEPV
jgi:hypothetical protein